jgi:hypothetical protein
VTNGLDTPSRRIFLSPLVVVNLEKGNIRVDDRCDNVILLRSGDGRDIPAPPGPELLDALIDAALGEGEVDAKLVHVDALK